MYCEDRIMLIELLHRVLSDALPAYSNVAAMYGETRENEGLQLAMMATLWHGSSVGNLAVSGFKGEEKGELIVSGFGRWSEILHKMYNIPERHIVGFPLATELPPCTDAEARGLVRFAKERGWKSLVIVVPPFHAVRAFVSTVSPAVREYPELKVYSHPSLAPSWTEKVMCFQGMPRGKRTSFIPSEFEKMERYLATGSHLAPEEVLAYLDRRDAR